MEEILRGLRYSQKRKNNKLDIILYNCPPDRLPELHRKLTALPNHPIIALFTAEEYLPQNLPDVSSVDWS